MSCVHEDRRGFKTALSLCTSHCLRINKELGSRAFNSKEQNAAEKHDETQKRKDNLRPDDPTSVAKSRPFEERGTHGGRKKVDLEYKPFSDQCTK